MTETYQLPRLYARAKTGKVKHWEVRVRAFPQNTAELLITHAAGLDDAPTERREMFLTGKNIGRANETTPYQQACSEALSRWTKQRDKGYGEDPDCAAANSNALGLPMPMLAHPIEKYKGELPELVWLQPKLNGHRCLAKRDGARVILWSRQGKLIETLPHIQANLLVVMPDGEIWDGELYVHGMRLQDIGSLVKKRQPDSARVKYHIYDCVRAESFRSRYAHLLAQQFHGAGALRLVTAIPAHPAEAMEIFDAFREAGYEGAMLRHGDSPYEVGFRSRSLLKIKGFEDAEFTVRDIIAGTPVIKGERTYQVAVLVCDGFKVTAPGTQAEKHAIWENRAGYIGRQVTVKYYELTKDGVPFHPVALQFREDL